MVHTFLIPRFEEQSSNTKILGKNSVQDLIPSSYQE